jgi:hypothetical protein
MDVAAADLDHEKRVDAAQGNRAVDMEEIARQHRGGLVRRNCRQVNPERCGAGGIRSRLSTRRTVDAPTWYPRPSSSPWIRLYPQPGFSPEPVRRTNIR